MSRFAKGHKVIAKVESTHPWRATCCASVAEMTGARHGQCVAAITDRGLKTFAFRSMKARDSFVAEVDSAGAA